MMNHKFELWEHCRSFGMISKDLTRHTFFQICLSVQKLHKIGLIHRDLKPENMFLSEDMKRVILIDLGSAEDLNHPEIRKMEIDKDPRRMTHVNFVGTSEYMSPECVRNKGEPALANDIWSLGCILYQLLTGLPPFRGGSDYLIFRRSTELRFDRKVPLLCQKSLNLIEKCLKIDPKERPTIEELLEDEYFRSLDKSDIDPPKMTNQEQILKNFITDLIKRHNVYELEG